MKVLQLLFLLLFLGYGVQAAERCSLADVEKDNSVENKIFPDADEIKRRMLAGAQREGMSMKHPDYQFSLSGQIELLQHSNQLKKSEDELQAYYRIVINNTKNIDDVFCMYKSLFFNLALMKIYYDLAHLSSEANLYDFDRDLSHTLIGVQICTDLANSKNETD